MKNAAPQKTENGARTSAFYIDNIRERRLLSALLKRPEISRHDRDGVVCAENSPDLVFRLRGKGFEIPCQRRQFVDRDGQKVRVGVYSLTASDRKAAITVLGCRGA